jgi:penicillin-binding protein 2
MMEAITEYTELFGFGEPTGIGLNESRGRVESREQHPDYRLGHALNAAIGQGRTLVTVLQLAMAYAAIANRGTLYQPQVVRRVETADGDVVREFDPVVRRRLDISDEHWDLVIDALIGVVSDPDGTAHEQALLDLEVGGKTGTAEVPPSSPPSGQIPRRLSRWFFNRDHGWFAGFAPARDPQIAVAVLIEHGGTGGRSAAPVALRILRDYFQEVAPLESTVVGVSDDAGPDGAGREINEGEEE